MNDFTANDLEAADLLARSGPMMARRRRRLHHWPATARAVTRYGLAGTGQVTASQAEMIAAARGRARQWLGMRHTSLKGHAGRAEPVSAVMAGWRRACRAE